ncbi:MAG: SpoVG family protein, partial [Planctomycetota bacterium]|nr:SpoVG family protein [Planctomycetota bacterium]
MEITEVRVKLMDEPGERLKAFCSITFDDAFVVRDLKIIEGSSGPFVARPSRNLFPHWLQKPPRRWFLQPQYGQCAVSLRLGMATKG